MDRFINATKNETHSFLDKVAKEHATKVVQTESKKALVETNDIVKKEVEKVR